MPEGRDFDHSSPHSPSAGASSRDGADSTDSESTGSADAPSQAGGPPTRKSFSASSPDAVEPGSASPDATDPKATNSEGASCGDAHAGDAEKDAEEDDESGVQGDDGPATLGELHEPQRLHSLTLLQRLLASLPILVFLLIPVVSNPSSQNVFYLFMTVAYGAMTLPAILLQYYRFSYRLTEKQIVIQSGVFNRKNRSIPIERVQNVQIEQNLIARLASIAKVKIETAGSSTTEGVLEYVGLQEAHRIRQAVRSFQRTSAEQRRSDEPRTPAAGAGAVGGGSGDADSPSEEPTEAADPADTRPSTTEHAQRLFHMPLQRVLLSGMFRFSLVYIAVIFSVFQFFEPDTLLNYVLASRSQMQTFVDAAYASPAIAAAVTVTFAVFFGWLTGIAINLNRYYGFRLWLDGDKLRKRHGLFTVTEGTIPLEKVQALILRTNPLMQVFGWYALEVQTVGLNVDEQGHRVVVPFAQLSTVLDIGNEVHAFDLPASMSPVSILTVRRRFVRYTLVLAAAIAPAVYFYPADWWHPLGVTLPWWGFGLTPLLALWAYLQYRNHGYDVRGDGLFVRRGVIARYTWVLPTKKHHVFYTTASLFQRRLNLKTLFVDTAGAAAFAYPEVIDLPAGEADTVMHRLHDRFRQLYRERIRRATGSADTRLSADERPQLPEEV